jgi:hypothetical protein
MSCACSAEMDRILLAAARGELVPAPGVDLRRHVLGAVRAACPHHPAANDTPPLALLLDGLRSRGVSR